MCRLAHIATTAESLHLAPAYDKMASNAESTMQNTRRRWIRADRIPSTCEKAGLSQFFVIRGRGGCSRAFDQQLHYGANNPKVNFAPSR
jgi:hypothetical protein